MFKKFLSSGFSLNVFKVYHEWFNNPQTRIWTILGTLAYFIMPFDFLPDFFPFFGQIDDVLLLIMFVVELGILSTKTLVGYKKTKLIIGLLKQKL